MILKELLKTFVAREQVVIYQNFPKSILYRGIAKDVPYDFYDEIVITVGAYSGLHSPVIEICLR